MGNWLDKLIPSLSRVETQKKAKSIIPDGLWKKCNSCEATLYRPELEKNQDVCPKCDNHIRISARKRLQWFLDEDNKEEMFGDLISEDKLKFKDTKKYKDRLSQAQKQTGEKEAIICIKGMINQVPLVTLAFEFAFMGGSMGAVVGEKFVRAAEYCIEHSMPLVCFSSSGGARMQEGLFSLMQMARTSAVLERMKLKSLPYISVMTDPVYGGVSASLAMLGDLNIAEPGSMIGFAGPRVIEQTVREKLPQGFQCSEFLLEHGAIDSIVHRHSMRSFVSRNLYRMMYSKNIDVHIVNEIDVADTSNDIDNKNEVTSS